MEAGIGTAYKVGSLGCIEFQHRRTIVKVKLGEVNIIITGIGDNLEIIPAVLEVGI